MLNPRRTLIYSPTASQVIIESLMACSILALLLCPEYLEIGTPVFSIYIKQPKIITEGVRVIFSLLFYLPLLFVLCVSISMWKEISFDT